MNQFFNGFFNKAINTQPQNNFVQADFNSLNKNAFKNSLSTILDMDEHHIAVIVKNNIDEIASDIISGNIPYIEIFSNSNFINGFIRAIGSIPIDHNVRLACNKLTYDYFTSDNAIADIKQKYLHISRAVNRQEINKLMSLGIDENTACNLALCRYSSNNEPTNVKRLNFALYHKDPNIMTEQMIVWIYEKLFDRISPLFYGVMFEVYSSQEEQDFGENFMEIYGTVSLACLDILNNMTSENIAIVINSYIKDWEYSGKPRVRFSLNSLSGDYSRISRVVENIIASGHYVP